MTEPATLRPTILNERSEVISEIKIADEKLKKSWGRQYNRDVQVWRGHTVEIS